MYDSRCPYCGVHIRGSIINHIYSMSICLDRLRNGLPEDDRRFVPSEPARED